MTRPKVAHFVEWPGAQSPVALCGKQNVKVMALRAVDATCQKCRARIKWDAEMAKLLLLGKKQ